MVENKQPNNKHHQVNNIIPHKARHSITLKRETVRKPAIFHDIKPKSSLKINDPSSRFKRSLTISKSPNIERFPKLYNHQNDSINQTKNKIKPIEHTFSYQDFSNYQAKHNQQPSHSIVQQAYLKSIEQQQKKNIHQLSNKSSKMSLKFKFSLITAVFIVALLGFFTLQQNQRELLFKEDQKTGFTTRLPSYILPGFSSIKKVFLKNNFTDYFKSNLSNSNYSLNESKINNKNQHQIIKKYVLFNYGIYQEIKVNNITIYLSQNNDATWIKNNIWYKLENHDKTLSIQQIISIAESV